MIPVLRHSPNRKAVEPYIKRALERGRHSSHGIRVDDKKHEVVANSDKSGLGVLFLEAPFILLPEYEMLNLIELGKACAYCGTVLKVDDLGKLRDDKAHVRHRSKYSKMERFIKGLDCDRCSLRWCCQKCKDADFKHNLLHHLPDNKTGTHNFVDSASKKKDVFLYGNWTQLRSLILEDDLEICYYGIMAILQVYYDDKLMKPFESLTFCDDIELAESFLSSGNETVTKEALHKSYQLLCDCFKKLDLSYDRYLKYLTIYKLNNFGGCIYLITSTLGRVAENGNANCRIEYYDEQDCSATETVIDSFRVKPVSENSVELIKESFVEAENKTPIYVTDNRSNKKILKVLNVTRLKANEPLTIKDVDYSLPTDSEDEFAVLSLDLDNEEQRRMRMIQSRHRFSTSALLQPAKNSKMRTASFTSSGSSFGEGIIKYNRAQIREMLQQLTLEEGIQEESEADDNFMLEVPSTFGKGRKTVRFGHDATNL
ncbi:hypothetical protein FOA43_001897 [Brettanomyces nanus]|uniref:Uncharacterized protein n=1 Tax=Eeniella nana TaxID=13502 RepID=A0A875RZH4_EENNA|nr:uncharacterized protein FOA43_001897 [Brettanomyces nanus]QPG74566.1 hypothetical protein FOA43_001897 [Brettanomyces nanus]